MRKIERESMYKAVSEREMDREVASKGWCTARHWQSSPTHPLRVQVPGLGQSMISDRFSVDLQKNICEGARRKRAPQVERREHRERRQSPGDGYSPV